MLTLFQYASKMGYKDIQCTAVKFGGIDQMVFEVRLVSINGKRSPYNELFLEY